MSYVLKLCGWYPSKMDGFSGDFVQRHARSIATQIPVVVVYAAKDLQRNSGGFKMEKNILGNLTEWRVYYPRKRWLDRVWSQWYYLRALKKVLPHILQEKGEPALVHINIAWKPAIWYNFLRKKYSWPVFVTENSTEYQPTALFNIRNTGIWRQHLTRQLFQECRQFISVSKQLAETIHLLYGNIPSTVVPNAVDTSLFFPVEKSDDGYFHLLHISTLSWQKNPEGLLRVFDQLLQKYTDLNITIIGPETPMLVQWQQQWLQRASDIHCTGLIPYPQVASHVQQANLLTLFSRYENLPCVILEALCAGVPVVSTNVGGIAEVINNTNGMVVEEGNEDAFLQAIESVKNGQQQFSKICMAEVAQEKYNYQQIGRDFVKAYNNAGICLD